uniref:glycosyl transferase family protein n=1 Tax=Sphingomonas sp. GlSt437 TaxID=3389970 RepID=UPI003A84A045
MSGGLIEAAPVLAGWDAATRELLLFAAVGFLVGGIDDLAIDLVYLWQRWLGVCGLASTAIRLGNGHGRIAVFIPAWDEAGVIDAMLRHTLATIDHPDYRIYVGTYPNDRATISAVAHVAESDTRVRLVIGSANGPTTKADCLNALWRALARDVALDGEPVRAIALHDAEDVVHPLELRLFDALLDEHDAVQLPVQPLPHRRSRLIGGHYLDEFAEAHGKQLVVRQALGAALPLAGVGCAIGYSVIARIAAERQGAPFDADSLTEDYELGLRIAALGGRATFARVRPAAGEPLIAVNAYFPATITAAVRQKARWMTGIALAGWDRTGWGQWHAWGEHWMRMRDRRAPLAVLVLVAAYVGLVGGTVSMAGRAVVAQTGAPPLLPAWLVAVNLSLLAWRLVWRAAFTARVHGWGEAALSVPRAIIGNVIAMLAARRALVTYVAQLRGGPTRWDKTEHQFPDRLPFGQP